MRILQYIHYIAIAAITCSCTLNIPYENQFSDPDAIASAEAARELLANAYSSMPNPEFDLSVLTDDFETTYLISKNTSLNNLYTWQPAAFETLAYNLWQSYYNVIANINTVLERTPLIVPTTEEEEKEIKIIETEAKILKAWCYFDLLRLFAVDYTEGKDNPGIILKDKLEMETLPRSSIESCITEIRTLLQNVLSNGSDSNEFVWLNKACAKYLLAELELYAGNYGNAITYAQEIISAKGYDVMAENEYKKLFSDDECQERLFALYTTKSFYQDLNYDWEKGDYLTVCKELVESYHPDDLRYATSIEWFKMPTAIVGDSVNAPNFGKYHRLNWEQTEIRYINKFRISGVCLLLAEAYCLNNDSRAIEVMNKYLAQRKAPLLEENLSGENLMKAILLEKRKEFVGEGIRYFDLKRYRKNILKGWRNNIADDDYRWTFPIPKEEYLYNNLVEQNEGWNKIES